MARLPITVTITTPLPVAIRDLPKLEAIAHRAMKAHDVDHHIANMTQVGNDLAITYTLTAK